MKTPRKTATKEQKTWMKENGYIEAQMDEFWVDNIETNFLVRNLNKSGMSWRDMNMSCVMQLPTQKERDLEAIKQKEIAEKAKAEAEAKAQADRAYYWKHFDEIMVSKIDNKEKLTEKELSALIDYEIDRDEGENRRWSRSVSSILSLLGRYFSLNWEQGLTEYQENEFYDQPYEVEKKTYEKTITVTEWVKKTI